VAQPGAKGGRGHGSVGGRRVCLELGRPSHDLETKRLFPGRRVISFGASQKVTRSKIPGGGPPNSAQLCRPRADHRSGRKCAAASCLLLIEGRPVVRYSGAGRGPAATTSSSLASASNELEVLTHSSTETRSEGGRGLGHAPAGVSPVDSFGCRVLAIDQDFSITGSRAESWRVANPPATSQMRIRSGLKAPCGPWHVADQVEAYCKE